MQSTFAVSHVDHICVHIQSFIMLLVVPLFRVFFATWLHQMITFGETLTDQTYHSMGNLTP